MKRFATLLLLPLCACQAAGSEQGAAGESPRSTASGTEESGDCPLAVSFGSYAMGIDGSTLRAVEALLDRDEAVSSVERRGWGREGEVTLCAQIRDEADVQRLYRQVAAALPPNPRGPIHVTTRSGLSAHAPRR